MIKDLKILNGNLDLQFDSSIYEYTVTVDSDTFELEFDLKLDENVNYLIRNNSLNDYENTIYLDIYKENELITYTFIVYKEDISLTSGINDYMKNIEIQNNSSKDVNILYIQYLSIGVFLSIIIIFSIIFRRKKKKH